MNAAEDDFRIITCPGCGEDSPCSCMLPGNIPETVAPVVCLCGAVNCRRHIRVTPTGRIPEGPALQFIRPPGDDVYKHIADVVKLQLEPLVKVFEPMGAALEAAKTLNEFTTPKPRGFDGCTFEHGCVQERLCGKLNRCAWGARGHE